MKRQYANDKLNISFYFANHLHISILQTTDFHFVSFRLLVLLTRMQILVQNRSCFLFWYLSDHWLMFTELLRKREGKHYMQDTYSSSLFKTRQCVLLDKTFPMARIELVSVNTGHFAQKTFRTSLLAQVLDRSHNS